MTEHEPQPPRARVFRDWTPPMLRSADIAAENGNLTQAVAICEWLLSDDAVAGALDARVENLIGLEVSFDPGDRESPELLDAIVHDWPDIAPEEEQAQILTYAILLGVAPARHVTRRDSDTGRVIPTPEFWTPQTLQQDINTGEWTIQDNTGVKHIVDPESGEWLLHTPFGARRPWARGLWRRLCRWVLLKQYAQRDWARHGEVAARVFAKTQLDKDGNAPPTSDEQRTQIVNEIRNGGGEQVIALPPGWDLGLLELTANTEQIYKSQIDTCNAAIRITIRGGDLSSDASGGGSYAAAASQAASNEAPKRRADGARWSTTLHDHTLVWYAQWNWGSQALAPYPRWGPSQEDREPADLPALATAVDTFDRLGYEINTDELKTTYGLTWLGKRGEPRAPAAPASPFGGFAAHACGSEREAWLAASNARDQAQRFVDKLGDEAAEQALTASAGLVDELMRVVQAAGSQQELDRMLREAFEIFDAETLNAITEKARVLAELAGRYAVLDEL